MADFRHESKFRDRFVRRTIEHALPRPDWWRVRIEELTEDMKTVRKGRLLLVTEKMLYTVEKDGLKKTRSGRKKNNKCRSDHRRQTLLYT